MLRAWHCSNHILDSNCDCIKIEEPGGHPIHTFLLDSLTCNLQVSSAGKFFLVDPPTEIVKGLL